MVWLLVGITLGIAAYAGPQPEASPPPKSSAQAPGPGTPRSSQSTPDDEFIEFLGTDDVADADWWEFLKKVAPRGDDPHAAPPQEAKQ